MRSNVIVIASIRLQDAAQMRLAQDDKMVYTLASDRSDQSFGKTVLPRRDRRDRLIPDAHGANSAHDDGAKDLIPIADEVTRPLIPRQCLCSLTRDPFRRRICSDVDPDQASAAQTDDNKGIEQIETNCRDDEQVHRGNVRRVVTQKGAPSLTWRSTSLNHEPGDARLRDVKPELEQFAVDARRSPKRILDAHPPDQRNEVRLDLRPSSQ